MTTPLITLPTQTFSEFVANMTAQWGANAGVQAVLLPGDPLLALFQSVSSQLVFLESIALTLSNLERAQTSTGTDLDTWMAQFSYVRAPATYAEGPITASTASVLTYQVVIPVGTVIETPGGAIQYQVIADTTQAAYNSSLNAYLIAVGSTSISVSVQAMLSGTASNVAANQLTVVVNSIPGLSTVTNPAAISNGVDAESDANFLAGFVTYLNSLAEATQGAIQNAIDSVQQGLESLLLENQTVTGATAVGQFSAIIDNGTGSPPSSLLNSIGAALDSVRAFCVQANVSGPVLQTVTISLNVRLANPLPNGLTSGGITSTVQTNIISFVNSLGIAQTLYLADLISIAMGVLGVTAVQTSTVTINGANSDFVPSVTGVARTAVADVTIGTY